MSLLVDIEKTFGSFHLKANFTCKEDVLALLGASGSGKSVTLKCIAGIETPDRGKIILDGRTLFDSEQKINLPPQKRKVGYLFQQYALFPNMSVEENIACGVRSKDKKIVHTKVQEMITSMDLGGCETKHPNQLSGGQQQRVALARILVNEPDVLLLDEPFSALDAHLRFQLEREVKEVIEAFKKPVILVSHDRDEAYRICDTIAIMHSGAIECMGNKHQVFASPKTTAGAKITGCKNIAPITMESDGRISVPAWGITLEAGEVPPKATHIGIRMHDISLSGSENPQKGRVMSVLENPFSYTIFLQFAQGCQSVGMEVEKSVWEKIKGDTLTVFINQKSMLLLEDDLEKN